MVLLGTHYQACLRDLLKLGFSQTNGRWLKKVTPIFKKGTKSDLNNYRPISVLPIVTKIFEKIIVEQLYDYLNKNKLLNNYQCGFHSLHSTLKALLETMNNSSLNIDNGLLNGISFINLSKKAFDTIDHQLFCVSLQTKEEMSTLSIG